MHASRFFLAASALLVQHALAQESGKSHLKREDDVYFSPADIVKRQIPATGEAVIEPPAECAEACKPFIELGLGCGGGKAPSELSDEELLGCACQPSFLTALKSCTGCAPQIFEGTDGSNTQTAVDDVAEQCTINDRPVAGFESTPNEEDYNCDLEDGEGAGADGEANPGDAGSSASGSDTAVDTPTSTASAEASTIDSPASDGSSSDSASGDSPSSTDDTTTSSRPTAAPIADDEDDSYDEGDDGASATATSSASDFGDDFGDFGGASSSFNARHVVATVGVAAITLVLACLF